MDRIIGIVGLIISSLLFIWMAKTFIPSLLEAAIEYFKENKTLTTICIFITIAIVLLSHIKEDVGAIIIFILAFLIMLPWFFAIIAIILGILKSPYSDFFEDIHFKYERFSKVGAVYFIIGYIIYVITGLIFLN